jgi:hypothetical protein
MSVAGYTKMDKMGNIKIRRKLNILNVNNNILKSRSQWKNHVLQMEDRQILKADFIIFCSNKKKHEMHTVKMERSTYSYF